RLEIVLHGEKLNGRFTLVRMKGRDRGGKENWLLIKGRDEFARTDAADEKRPAEKRSAPSSKRESAPARPAAKSSPPAAGVTFTNTDKVLFPDDGITKGDVIEFYRRIAPRLLPFLKDRPATLERLPEGLGGGSKPHFWQKDTPDYYPDWV